ncbi:hypothetical protein QE152_g22715 [Popillia japonica]|uniref:Uncharacterized protein n=1 Tax=Popillia japonica TaxID=7064 RepID=A0AAW1KJU6_POPJA
MRLVTFDHRVTFITTIYSKISKKERLRRKECERYKREQRSGHREINYMHQSQKHLHHPTLLRTFYGYFLDEAG